MTFTIVGYNQSVDEGGLDVELTPIDDPIVREEGKYIYVPDLNQILGSVVFIGSTGVRAYIDTPSLRRINYQHISPLVLGLVMSPYAQLALNRNTPVLLDVNEGMKLISNADPAGAETRAGFILLGDGVPTPVTGEIFHARLSAVITEVAGKWASGEMTFENPLPVGTYQIVGARVIGNTNTLAFRFISLTDVNRPGGLTHPDIQALDYEHFRNGELGVWMEFDTARPPSLEVFAHTAGGSAQEIILDLIKTG